MANLTYFNVHPRYTPGSGAMVDEATAKRVALEERHFYDIATSGAFGEADMAKAATEGLKGIVEKIREHKGGWMVTDLITGDTFWRGEVKPRRLLIGDRLMVQRKNVRDVTKYRSQGLLKWGVRLQDPKNMDQGYATFGDGELVKVERLLPEK